MTGKLVMIALLWGTVAVAWLHDSGRTRMWWYRRQARRTAARARR